MALISLEDQLATGMREQTAGLVPATDLVDRAARANRRRRLRLASATGGLAVAAALAVVFSATGTPTAPGPGPQGFPAPPVLTAAEVSQKALAALATDDVEHVMISFQQGDHHATHEAWYDSTTRDFRDHSLTTADDGSLTDYWAIHHQSTATVTDFQVDHSTRTWWRSERPDRPDKAGSWFAYTGDDLRTQLREGDYEIVGDEEIDGHPVVHLRRTQEGGVSHLWVEAGTYRAVRRQLIRTTATGDAVFTFDFAWQPRTPESLQPFEFTAPAGYRQVEPS